MHFNGHHSKCSLFHGYRNEEMSTELRTSHIFAVI